jgi:hypothetical protein
VCSSISPGEDAACQANLDDVCVDWTARLLVAVISVWEANKVQPVYILLGSKSVQARKRVVELAATERSSEKNRAHDGGLHWDRISYRDCFATKSGLVDTNGTVGVTERALSVSASRVGVQL